MPASRRDFLLGCSAAIAAYAGSRISHASFADETQTRSGANAASDTLIVIFLRGGMDGLHLLGPADDKDYVQARGESLRVTDKGENAGLALSHDFAKLDFRLHPNAAPLKELYDSKQLAFIHACGITSGTRSHFEAMDLIERGDTLAGGGMSMNKPGAAKPAPAMQQMQSKPGSHADTGWLSRHLQSMLANGTELGETPAFAAMDGVPSSLLGFGAALSGKKAQALGLWHGQAQMDALLAMYTPAHPFHSQAHTALRAIEAINKRLPRDGKGEVREYTPAGDAKYPDGDLSESLQTLAQLIKLQVGLRVACVDFGGWDTHQTQTYFFPQRTRELSTALHAFITDIRDQLGTTSVVVLSEFGRRLKANKSDGTDHGHGTVMMALGGNVRGGKIYGSWPGLATQQLDSGADLAVTTDHRMVLGEMLLKRAGNARLGEVFPGLRDYKPLGIFAGADVPAIL